MTRHEVTRRNFLRTALSAGVVLMADGSMRSIARAGEPAWARHSNLLLLAEPRRFAPVKVARNRIIRTVVGLRPYREEGFVIEAERMGNKLLVHNYGHGGAGVTLSWGTSSLAVDKARDHLQTQRARAGAPHRFAVLGCGVMGLSTARLVQRRLGGSVTIYAKELPPQTTSNIAGALWYPASAFNPQMVSAKFMGEFSRASYLSNRAFQELVGPEYGVRWTDTYESITRDAPLNRELAGVAQLYPQTEIFRDPETYFGFPYARQFSTMMIEPHTYLRALLRDFYIAGGKIVVKDFKKREEVARLSFDHDDWSLEPNAEQTTGIIEAHAEIMKRVKK